MLVNGLLQWRCYMSYYIGKILDIDFESAIKKTTAALQIEGFGILTEIDVQQKFKEKLNKEFHKYRILGACNPAYAYRALNVEDKIGTMLPCNVIIQEVEGGTEIAVINPKVAMKVIDNPDLAIIADEIYQKLQLVIDSL